MNDRRPARVFENSPGEIEDNLAELYKENPFLHDMGNADYKNRNKRDRVLNEKSEELIEEGISLCNADTLSAFI